jgi:glutaminase
VNSDERVRAHLEFYLQLCSMTGTTRDMASVASALANGGTNPITKEYTHFFFVSFRFLSFRFAFFFAIIFIYFTLFLRFRKIFPAACVRNCLSIMFSCGMYDYSGGTNNLINDLFIYLLIRI